MEIVEFIWQNVSVRNEVKLLSSEPLLHLHVVIAEAVFPCDLVALWKVIYSLELVQSFIQVALARAGRPEQIPLMRLRMLKAVVFKELADQLSFAFEYLVEHLRIVNMVTSLLPLVLQ